MFFFYGLIIYIYIEIQKLSNGNKQTKKNFIENACGKKSLHNTHLHLYLMAALINFSKSFVLIVLLS